MRLFALGVALFLYLDFLFDGSGKLSLIPRYFTLAYGYFLGWMLLELFKKPARNQITRYTRRETDNKGGRVLMTEITVEEAR